MVALDSGEASPRFAASGDFDRRRWAVSEAEKIGGAQMRHNGSVATGEDHSAHLGAVAVRRMADAKGPSKARVQVPSRHGAVD